MRISAPTAVTTTNIVDGTIINADVNAAAAIAYSKLSLTGSIVNADISATAAIAYSKLNSGAIDADLVPTSSISYNLGSGTKLWNQARIYRLIANYSEGNFAPYLDKNYDIGSASRSWRDAFIQTIKGEAVAQMMMYGLLGMAV